MSPKNYFEIACPLCGHPNRFRLTEQQRAALGASGRVSFSELVACDSEEGGCDQTFAFELTASVAYKSRTFRLEEKRPDDPLSSDRRTFEVHSRSADDPESGSTELLTAREVAARAKTNAIFRLALELKDGDDFKLVSTDALSTIKIVVREAEMLDFETFLRAKDGARKAAVMTGDAHEVRFSPESGRFFVFSTQYGQRFGELIATVEPPVTFRITVGERAGELKGSFQAQVYSDDTRANPDLQAHGDDELYVTPASVFLTAEAAARDAADWIRAEFGEKFDVEILCDGYNVEPDEIPLDETPPARRNYWKEEEAEAARDVDPSRCIHGAPVNVFCVKCEG